MFYARHIMAKLLNLVEKKFFEDFEAFRAGHEEGLNLVIVLGMTVMLPVVIALLG